MPKKYKSKTHSPQRLWVTHKVFDKKGNPASHTIGGYIPQDQANALHNKLLFLSVKSKIASPSDNISIRTVASSRRPVFPEEFSKKQWDALFKRHGKQLKKNEKRFPE